MMFDKNLKSRWMFFILSALLWFIADFFVYAEAASTPPPASNYAPNLWFDSREQYFPTNPLDFYYENRMEISGEIAVSKYNQLSVREKLNNLVVLYHIEDEGNQWVYQYWFFYVFNDFKEFTKNKHYGDWESVFVFVDKNTGKVAKAIGTAHQREIFDTEIYNPNTNHLWAYIGEGSHANCINVEIDDYCERKRWKYLEKWDGRGFQISYNNYNLIEINADFINNFRGATTLERSVKLGINVFDYLDLERFADKEWYIPWGGAPPTHAWAQESYTNPEELRPYGLKYAVDYASNKFGQAKDKVSGLWNSLVSGVSDIFKKPEPGRQSAGLSAALFTPIEQTRSALLEEEVEEEAVLLSPPRAVPKAEEPAAARKLKLEATEEKELEAEKSETEIKEVPTQGRDPDSEDIGKEEKEEKGVIWRWGSGGGGSDIPEEKTESTSTPPIIDATPPSAITDLTAISGDIRGAISLSWTAPGDDESVGTSTEYILRYATSTIASSTWDLAVDIFGEPAPSAAGSGESMIITGLEAGETYYFALKSKDEADNISEISNITSGVASALAESVVISEVQLHEREFVELYNPTGHDIDMSGWHLLYFPSGRNWDNPYSNKEFQAGAVIPAKGYYLIGLNGFIQDEFIHFDWIPDSFPQINNYDGSLAISASSSAATEDVRIDALGWGGAGYVFEGGSAAAPELYRSLVRRTAGWDTDDNGADFIEKDWPNPKNSSGVSVTIVSDKVEIAQDSVWDLSGSPYLLESNLNSYPAVAAAATLTIEPGVTVKGINKNYPALMVYGVLRAEGAADSHIVFTANTSTPSAGDWSGIVFDSAGGNSVLDYVDFEYGGYVNEMLKINSSQVTITNSAFKHSLKNGIYLENSSPLISDSVFSSNTLTAIIVSGPTAAPTIENCRFEDNTGNGTDILSGAAPVISGNIFSGNYYPITMKSSYPELSGNEAANNDLNGIVIDQESVFSRNTTWKKDLPYILFSSSKVPTVATGTVLTLEPGVIIKPHSLSFPAFYTALEIQGELVAQGTTEMPIVFTSIRDDTLEYGGDTNNDSGTTTPDIGDWKNIKFSAGSISLLDHVLFRYGSANVLDVNAEANVLENNITYGPQI